MYIDIIFFAIFISQIVLISYYYPKKTYDRNIHVLRTYPASEYPKLYQHSPYADPVKALHKTIRRNFALSIAIAVFGLSLMLAMVISGYAPSGIKENKHIAFVMLFSMLQALPYIFLEITTYNWYKAMRRAAKGSTRKAELSPRKLFDFISPFYIVVAVLVFFVWLAYYLYNKGFSAPWDWQTSVTVFGMTGMNLLLIGLGYKLLRGTKLDPHQAYKDQRQLIKTIIRVYVFTSIMMSTQLIVFDMINLNGWDKFEPVALSIYFQIIIVFGIGEVLRKFKVENVNFDVYKEEPRLA